MGLFSSRKEKPHLGIDIGTGAIKVVKIHKFEKGEKKGRRGEIENYGIVKAKTPRSVRSAGLQILDFEIIKMLRLLLKEMEEPSKDVAMSIPMFSSFIQEMRLPPMPDSEVEKAIQFEARSRIPVPIKDVRIRWEMVPTSGEETKAGEDSPERKVLLIAVPNDVIFRYQSITKELGLTLKALEVEIFSVIRALNLKETTSSNIILDIGARNTNVSLVKDGFLRLSHNVEKGGDDITHVIAQGLGVNNTRAEEFKKQEGLTGAANNKALGDLLYPVIDTIAHEVQRVVDTAMTTLGDGNIEKIILMGGTGELRGLKEYLKTKLNINVDIANPWATIDYSAKVEKRLQNYALPLVTATGLALY